MTETNWTLSVCVEAHAGPTKTAMAFVTTSMSALGARNSVVQITTSTTSVMETKPWGAPTPQQRTTTLRQPWTMAPALKQKLVLAT